MNDEDKSIAKSSYWEFLMDQKLSDDAVCDLFKSYCDFINKS